MDFQLLFTASSASLACNSGVTLGLFHLTAHQKSYLCRQNYHFNPCHHISSECPDRKALLGLQNFSCC